MQALQSLQSIAIIERIQGTKTYRRRFDPFSLDDEEFEKQYHFSKETTETIIDLVREELQMNRRGCGTTPELQVLTALRCWGRREVQQYVAVVHGLSQSTTSRICKRVASAMAQHAPDYVQVLTFLTEQQDL